jgi:hypothetical protein
MPSIRYGSSLANPFARRRMVMAAAVVLALLSVATIVRVTRASASPQVPVASLEVTPQVINVQSQRMYDGSVDGDIKLILWPSGAYNVQAHVHNGAKLKREFSIGCVIYSTISGAAFVFATSDKIGGTSPFSTGGSKYRDPITSGTRSGISDDWANLTNPNDPKDQGLNGTSIWPDCRITASQDKAALVKQITDGLNIGSKVVSVFF